MDVSFGKRLYSSIDANQDQVPGNQNLRTSNLADEILQEMGITDSNGAYTIENSSDDNPVIENMLSNARAQSQALKTRGQRFPMELESCPSDGGETDAAGDDNPYQYVIDPERKAATEDSTSGVTGLNGKIDNSFKQGTAGDCWLLGSIQAIAQNEKGRQILNDSIKILDNGNVEITLKGVNKKYTFTKQEIMGRNDLSSGDLDVRALEMAVEKYIEENPGKMKLWNSQFDGNQAHTAFKILVGGSNKYTGAGAIFGNTTKWNITDKTIDRLNDPDTIATTSKIGEGSVTFTDAKGMQQKLIGNHMYAVKGSDAQYVYLVNPHDTSKVLSVPRDVYKKFFSTVEICKI